MSLWDIVLVVAVTTMGTAVAFLRDPEQKAFVLMLPIPFTLATLSLGRPLDATNVLGMGLLFCYTIGVWALRVRFRLPILVAIALSAGGYCLVGAGVARIVPSGDLAFWGAVAAVWAVAAVLIRTLPYRSEPDHRTPLPVWIKAPAIAAVVLGIVGIKEHLGGFMTLFPMVGVVAAYESRYSLWTIVRRVPWVMLFLTPMMMVIRITQPYLGMPGAVAVAWPVLLALLWAFRKRYGRAASKRLMTESVGNRGTPHARPTIGRPVCLRASDAGTRAGHDSPTAHDRRNYS